MSRSGASGARGAKDAPGTKRSSFMTERKLACPSADPRMENARPFAVVAGTADAPRASYLAKGVDIPEAMRALPPGVSPTRVFRFTGTCSERACSQFANGACQLGKTANRVLEAVAETVPACAIRADCRWYAENGSAICLKCPQVVTSVRPSEPALLEMLKQVDRSELAMRPDQGVP